jgi:uncharacterized surface protein with fasciclin (FAS1) repeats
MSLRKILPFLSVLLVLFSCKKKEFDEFYKRPEGLEPPIYQVLESKGNFKSFLQCIDKAGYKEILSAAGYWTLFAPTDSAFDVYLKQNNLSGVDKLNADTCQKIVTYSLVYNAFKKERIGDYQSNAGWVKNNAFRRRTANYKGVYTVRNLNSINNKIVANNRDSVKLISSNRNNNGTTFYVDADNNNKYIPYFVDGFMQAKGLTAADYNYFYPNTPYTGFNVVDAVVTLADVPAENGVIHIVNKVISSLPSIDDYLGSNPDYSEFKKLFEKFLVQYSYNQIASQLYNNRFNKADSIFTKIYNFNIAYSLNNENYQKLQDNDGQQNSYTIFAPKNDALLNYINTVLLENYSRIEDLPINVIYDFVNAHLWTSAVWPSKFQTTFNVLSEEARFDPVANIVDKKILSNGIFYGTNKVQEASVFSSVFGKAYLDPNYSVMTSLLSQELKFQITNLKQKYTLFLVSNNVLKAAGYEPDPLADNSPVNQWKYTPPGGGTVLRGSSALVRLLRVLNLHVVPNVDITSLAGSGVVMGNGGEFVRYAANKLTAAGNSDANNFANVLSSKTAKNGTVFYIDRVLEHSDVFPGKHIEALGKATTSPFNLFWQYLSNSTLYTASTGDILNVAAGTFYTFLIPDNTAIQNAVNAGLLPGTGTGAVKTPNFKPTAPADQQLVEKFIYYHILNKKSLATNGLESGSYETLFKDRNGEAGRVFVDNNTINAMKLTDMNGRTADLIYNNSNNLGARTTFHLINNYLKYTE